MRLNNEEQKYKEFFGKTTEQMPKLLAEGRKPMTMYDLMKKRVEVIGTDIEDDWWNNYFDTCDGVVVNKDGRVKIVREAKFILELTPDTELKYGAVEISDEDFEKLEGLELTPKEVEKYANKWLTKEEVMKNKIWLYFVKDDKELLKKYTDKVFA